MKHSVKTFTISVALLMAAAGMLSISGCRTPPLDEESQMPWNTPQDWESSPMMPGYGNRY